MAKYEQKDPIAVKPGDTVIFDEPIQIETDQEKLIETAWCQGFNAGFEYAKEQINFYIKEMGYAFEVPKAYEIYEKALEKKK